MEIWASFWGWLLIFVLLVFAFLSVVIAIGGFFDVKALFMTIDEQHHTSASESEDDVTRRVE